eukprot:8131516-Karenia_brevis.AAC.1
MSEAAEKVDVAEESNDDAVDEDEEDEGDDADVTDDASKDEVEDDSEYQAAPIRTKWRVLPKWTRNLMSFTSHLA